MKVEHKTVIFDLDNCLADDGHRIGLIDWEESDPNKRYLMYHGACWSDAVGNGEVFDAHLRSGHIPLFITGRPEAMRRETVQWLISKFKYAPSDRHLLMRPRDCDLTSVDLKEMLLKRWLSEPGFSRASAHDIVHAYDDRDDIVNMYIDRFRIPASVVKIHNQDAYRNSDLIPRNSTNISQSPMILRSVAPRLVGDPMEDHPLCGAGTVSQADMNILLDRAADGPVQGARPVHKTDRRPASEILRAMADTFDERNAVYRDNSRMIPKLIRALFPHGVPSRLVEQEEFHLFELILVKLARFASTDLAHIDSIHDIAPYCAMIETILKEKQQ